MDTDIPLVSVVIVYWNGIKVIDRCLESLFAQTFQDFEVILVDNGSMQHPFTDFEARWPRARVIRLEENRGFAAANNVGAGVAKGKWLALLNSDAFPDAHWLESLLEAAGTYQDLFFFTSCQIQANDLDTLDGTGDEYNIRGVAWRRQSGQHIDQAVQIVDEVFSACGAAALYPRAAFLLAGGFDEDFFSYLEDVDLGFRLRLLGYRCLYVPEAKVLHIGSASLGKESEFAIYYSQRNMLWTFVKNMPAPYIWRYLPLHIVFNFVFAFYYGLCCCPCISWKAKRDAILKLPTILQKRKEIQANVQVDVQEIMRVIRFPVPRSHNPIGLLVLIPKLIIGFIGDVVRCRQDREAARQAISV